MFSTYVYAVAQSYSCHIGAKQACGDPNFRELRILWIWQRPVYKNNSYSLGIRYADAFRDLYFLIIECYAIATDLRLTGFSPFYRLGQSDGINFLISIMLSFGSLRSGSII